MRRITMIYQRLAKVFLICSDAEQMIVDVVVLAKARTTPAALRQQRSIRSRHQLVPARARIKLAATLALDGGTALRRCCVLRERHGAAEAIGATARLVGGKGSAGGGDADDEDSSGGDFDQQSHQWSHEASPPQ